MAGGQATNAGIDYQQRVSAWLLLNLYIDSDISFFFENLNNKSQIEKIHFETDTPIDDLRVDLTNSKTLFFQIKRNLALSSIETSDFYKTIEQFLIEEINGKPKLKQYILATTTDSSKKIRQDFRKILISIQLNDKTFSENPLNESERDTFEKVKALSETIYLKHAKTKLTEETYISFLKKISIEIIDIENGHPIEKAALMTITSIGFKKPELIWSILIKNCLFYASERLSIDKKSIEEILNRYIQKETEISSDDELQEELFKTEVIRQGEYAVGKDVLLIKSFHENFDYMIVELYRFTTDCKPKCTYYDNKIKVASGMEWIVIQRFATHAGLERYLDKNISNLKGDRIAMLPAKDIETVESTECAQLHKSFLEDLFKKSFSPLSCIHCGKGVYTNEAYLIEVDDRDTQSAVGNIHETCVRPIDRIIGIPILPNEKEEEYLKTFDFKLWISLVLKGQGLFNALKLSPNLMQGRMPILAWNPHEEYDAEYSYCVRFTLEDGTFSYDYHRSRIVRLNKMEAESRKEMYETKYKEDKDKNDPYCITSINHSSGNYSHLVKTKNPEEVILEIIKVEVVRYSNLIAKAFNKEISYYAPLCILRDSETETFINISNVIPLISDPLNFKNILNNWVAAGISFENIELKIIKSDKDFDNYIRMFLADGYVPIIDPELDKNQQLIKGYPIQNYDDIIEKGKQKMQGLQD
jgi:hypothetical protein